jgi:hypothetical protein
MLEIQPISTMPVVKPKEFNKGDKPTEKQPRNKKQQAEQQDAEPIQHIDEIV